MAVGKPRGKRFVLERTVLSVIIKLKIQLEQEKHMKFIHLSDLHLGKRIHGFSMLEDQKYILEQIIQIVKQEQADGSL